jgi:(p)ppGpp synthase/HD superfamily hydrolase
MLSIPYEKLLQRATHIATEAHQGQSSKTGGPFIDHVRRVAGSVTGADETLVAWLHDVIEKGPGWTLDRLREEGFPEHVVRAVDAMSKRAGEDYFDFVRRSIRDPLALPVKRADLIDNLAQMHQIGGDGSKFLEALRILEAGQPGTS